MLTSIWTMFSACMCVRVCEHACIHSSVSEIKIVMNCILIDSTEENLHPGHNWVQQLFQFCPDLIQWT